jgi:hypothetical protein
MIVKKPSPSSTLTPRPQNQKELQFLYARRTAIDTLIQSLERYDRFRARSLEMGKQKSA